MTFSHLFYVRDRVNEESPAHKKAKERIKALLCRQGFKVREEYAYPLLLGELGQRNYKLDLFAVRGNDRLDIELDGESHNSVFRPQKDGLRDNHVRMSGLTVVRFQVKDVNGFKFKQTGKYYRLSDEEILARIEAHGN